LSDFGSRNLRTDHGQQTTRYYHPSLTPLRSLLDELAQAIAGPGLPPARADARDLIAAILDKPRFWPSANPTLELDEPIVDFARVATNRLREGMPFQYAVGKASFRHLTLHVDRRVLIPRPETELIVDLLLTFAATGTAADVGTGSGAIALSLAAEGRFDHVVATDLSGDALEVARGNLERIPAEKRAIVEFRQGNLLGPLRGESFRAIVSNPPYISPLEAGDLPDSVRSWEPPLALFSDEDGMAAIRAIVREAPQLLEPGGVLVLEIDARRAALARACAETEAHLRDVELRMDLTGRERFLVARRKES
jgi:release factor glutamine methyltransferase